MQQMLRMEVVNVTGCVPMNNVGPSVREKKRKKKDRPIKMNYGTFLFFIDTLLLRPSSHGDRARLTVAYFFKRWGKGSVAK